MEKMTEEADLIYDDLGEQFYDDEKNAMVEDTDTDIDD